MKNLRIEILKSVLATARIAVLAYAAIAGLLGERTVTAQTQDPFLSRRIDSLEQRFYGIESRIGRVEQESRSTASRPSLMSGNNDAEIRLLRSEVDNLRLRLGEAECGLAKVDERTLTAAARTARLKANASKSDICRQDRESAVQLSARP